jgi:hypothetical protein
MRFHVTLWTTKTAPCYIPTLFGVDRLTTSGGRWEKRYLWVRLGPIVVEVFTSTART